MADDELNTFMPGAASDLTDNPLPDDAPQTLPEDHPALDSATNIDAHEQYDAGTDAAADAVDPGSPAS